MTTADLPEIAIAANNGDIGGGEVMLLAIAEALTVLGATVSVVGPAHPSGLVEEARRRGFTVIALESQSRAAYMMALRRWDRKSRRGILWCNGLLPAVATSLHRQRIVHLHQRPHGAQRALAVLARFLTLVTLVPSEDMATVVRGARVLSNWVDKVAVAPRAAEGPFTNSPVRLGFLGRPSTDKGIELLVNAVRALNERSPGQYRLVVGGESRFVSGESRDSVERSLEGLGGLVERTGWIAPEDFFEKVDVLVCPSIWPEPFGLVVAEAMSARVPVVVSDAGALPEVVGPEHPWISRARDAADLARVIELAAAGDIGVVDESFSRWQQKWSPQAGHSNVAALISVLVRNIGSES